MNNSKVNKSLRKVAEKNGVSYEEVRREIDFAIVAAIQNCERNGNPFGQGFLASVPRSGGVPTAEELIDYLLTRGKI